MSTTLTPTVKKNNAPQMVGELQNLLMGDGGITQSQVSAIRDQVVKIGRSLNLLVRIASTAMRLFAGDIVREVNNGVGTKKYFFSDSGNVVPGLVKYTFDAANTAEELAHGLGRYPFGYLVLRKYPNGAVFDGSPQQWNASTAFLQCDTAGVEILVLFF